MGPMIREADAVRVGAGWTRPSPAGRDCWPAGIAGGTLFEPTLLADVDPKMKISCDEVFGPAVAVTRVESIEQALELANDTRYGPTPASSLRGSIGQ